MKKIKLIFGTCNSIPLDLPEQYYENAYQKAYRPFLETAYNNSKLPLTLHFSGPLLSWLERRHAEFITVLREMISRKRLDMLGGGYYEPILPLVPPSDRTGQIEMMTTYLRKTLGRRSRGFWIARQIWNNHMAYTLKNCGMEYSFLDEKRFMEVGIQEGHLLYPVLSEEQGKAIQIFPLCSRIMDRMFHNPPSEIIHSIKKIPSPREWDSERDIILSLILPGEALNSSGGDAVQECHVSWLKEFFSLLRENKDWIEPISLGKALNVSFPLDKRYFSTSSYNHLMKWQKDAGNPMEEDNAGSCNYRHFLTRYPESNLLYSKMLYTHIMANQYKGDKSRKKTSREGLWKGQNHSPYWHGPEKGIYDIQLRHSAYRFLIEAEKTTRETGIFHPALIPFDFDLDGMVEYLYQGHTMNAYCHLQGGILMELDYIPSSWNYLNTFTKPETSGERCYPGKAFHDHFLENLDNLDINQFKKGQYQEVGDFLKGYYEVLHYYREKYLLVLGRNGSVDVDGQKKPLRIRKQYDFKRNGVELKYDISNCSQEKITYVFASELNLSLPSPLSCESNLYYQNSREEFMEITDRELTLKDLRILQLQDVMNNTSIQMEYSQVPDTFCCFPLETPYHDTTGKQELLYQGTTLLPVWEIELFPGESWTVDLSLRVGKSSGKAFA